MTEVVPLGEDGDELTRSFDNCPVEVTDETWVQDGDYFVTSDDLDFGIATSAVVVEGFRITVNLGFLTTSVDVSLLSGGCKCIPGDRLTLDAGNLKVHRDQYWF